MVWTVYLFADLKSLVKVEAAVAGIIFEGACIFIKSAVVIWILSVRQHQSYFKVILREIFQHGELSVKLHAICGRIGGVCRIHCQHFVFESPQFRIIQRVVGLFESAACVKACYFQRQVQCFLSAVSRNAAYFSLFMNKRVIFCEHIAEHAFYIEPFGFDFPRSITPRFLRIKILCHAEQGFPFPVKECVTVKGRSPVDIILDFRHFTRGNHKNPFCLRFLKAYIYNIHCPEHQFFIIKTGWVGSVDGYPLPV